MPPPDHPALEVAALSHSYGQTRALEDVTFAVRQGELFGLLGPNGGGKTTLLRIVSTLLKPNSGLATVFGFDTVANSHDVRKKLGIVFQNNALDAEMTVLENLSCQGALVGLRGSELQSRIDELLAVFGLSDRKKSRISTLSGGLARRTDLARGLLHRPPLLILDEPTTGLDPTARRELWTALDRLRKSDRTTIIVATHLMSEAERCDRIAILNHGQLTALDSPSNLRSEIGGESLWLTSKDPEALARLLLSSLGLSSQIIGDMLWVDTPEPTHTLSRALEAFPTLIDSATVRKPTLDDVFAARTGSRLLPVA